MSPNPYESFRELDDIRPVPPRSPRPAWLDLLLCIIAASIVFGFLMAAGITYTALGLHWFDGLGPVVAWILVLFFVGFAGVAVVTRWLKRRKRATAPNRE
jgi:hypothetical protein